MVSDSLEIEYRDDWCIVLACFLLVQLLSPKTLGLICDVSRTKDQEKRRVLGMNGRRHLGLTRIKHLLIHDADFLPNREVVLILICDFLTGMKFSIQCGINWGEHAPVRKSPRPPVSCNHALRLPTCITTRIRLNL